MAPDGSGWLDDWMAGWIMGNRMSFCKIFTLNFASDLCEQMMVKEIDMPKC